MDNFVKMRFPAKAQNEAFARMAVSAFAMSFDPTISTLSDIKAAVSEAVTNAIIHAYDDDKGEIELRFFSRGRTLYIETEDFGKGIEDVKKAMEPMFTTKSDGERSGLGFTVMESFMDGIEVISKINKGTTVRLKKTIENDF